MNDSHNPHLVADEGTEVSKELADALQGPGGDSRPDLIDPKTAHFDNVAQDELMTTDRDPAHLPPATRGKIPPSEADKAKK